MKTNWLIAVALISPLLSLGSTSASAALISGNIIFAGGFETQPTLVSTDTSFNIIEATTNPATASGDLGTWITSTSAIAGNIDVLAPGNMLYQIDGFTFALEDILADTNGALDCFAGACFDSRNLTIGGTVSGNGFTDTAFAGVWAANGGCVEGDPGACTADGYSSRWSAAITMLDTPSPVPLPAAGWLFFSALAGLFGRKVFAAS